MALDIQSQIELFSSQAGALCHMLTFYHGCHLDSFPWQCSDGGLLTHAERLGGVVGSIFHNLFVSMTAVSINNIVSPKET